MSAPTKRDCPDCLGTGTATDEENDCKTCEGEGAFWPVTVDDESGNEVPMVPAVLETEEEAQARILAKQEEDGRKANQLAEHIGLALSRSEDGALDPEQVRVLAEISGYNADDCARVVTRAKERGIIRKTEEERLAEVSAAEMARRDVAIGLRRGVAAALHKAKPSGITPFKHCFVRPIDIERATTSGVIMVDKAPERPSLGLVIAVGAGFNKELQNAGNNRVLKAGDTVIFSRYGGQEIMLPEGKFHILASNEVFAIYEPAAGIVS